MAITTSTTIHITIEDNGLILIRVGKRAFDDDGSLIGERFNRTTLEPGTDISTQPLKIQRIANIVWTQAVIDAYNAAKAAHLTKVLGG
jgi:hypothetical protein